MAAASPKPECLSLIVCDDIFRDEASKKLLIVGTFHVIHVPSLPWRHPRMAVLFTLTNAHGPYNLAVRIEHEKTGNLVLEIKGPLQVDDPLAICDFNMTLVGVEFKDEGKHWIVLEADGGVLTQRPILVQRVTPKESPDDSAQDT